MSTEPTAIDRLINVGGRPVTMLIWVCCLAGVGLVVLSSLGVGRFASIPTTAYAYLTGTLTTLVWLRATDLAVGALVAGIARRWGLR